MDAILRQSVPSSISLDNVIWKHYFKLSQASLGQIIISFCNILKVQPKNQYEINLYENLKPLVHQLVNNYNTILVYTNKNEHDIKYYNLIVNLPKTVSINEEQHGQIILGHAKIGCLIQAAKQRIEFIIGRDIPDVYKQDQNLSELFLQLQKDMRKFKDDMIEFEKAFVLAINLAHRCKFD